MRHKKLKLIAVLLLYFVLTGLQAQETVPATGGNASGSGGSVSYSVGQVVYITNKGTNGSVAPGVQQPFEISIVDGIEVAKDITLQCSAYPNPASDYLVLKVDNFDQENLSYQLLDINGKLLMNKIIESNETRIEMSQLIPATYFLKIIQIRHSLSSQKIKIFKIIKN